uniref:Uncharacterized protein n=3 Tax=Anthoceros TaxID=3233 RepID=A0A2P1L4X5_ANTAG|nr:hypothetical protein AnanMp42 [Anthoceros angustus]YP_009863158.1 hypothetical protein [Anthoceros punctatus]YP_009863200.1 hypothetical protein [Anthoceros agrestis]AVP12861.1 hypothetical protein AnanMp42 [Anthoceros angustus]QKD76614.1 hypothetical protein [Anthoceros punctatus]QKD76656.1 hypothetical protein [Anthoceros agrestis]
MSAATARGTTMKRRKKESFVLGPAAPSVFTISLSRRREYVLFFRVRSAFWRTRSVLYLRPLLCCSQKKTHILMQSVRVVNEGRSEAFASFFSLWPEKAQSAFPN